MNIVVVIVVVVTCYVTLQPQYFFFFFFTYAQTFKCPEKKTNNVSMSYTKMFCCYLSHVAQLFLPVEFQTKPYQLKSDCSTLGLLQVKAHYKDRPAAINKGQNQEDTL